MHPLHTLLSRRSGSRGAAVAGQVPVTATQLHYLWHGADLHETAVLRGLCSGLQALELEYSEESLGASSERRTVSNILSCIVSIVVARDARGVVSYASDVRQARDSRRKDVISTLR